MGALVFVTAELSPFTLGGIGRVIHNMLHVMSPSDRARAVALVLDADVPEASFEAMFPGARLIVLDSAQDHGRYRCGRRHPPQRAFADIFQWKSSVILRALYCLSKEVEIDYVEFPDWAGLGFATIQEKRLRGFLQDATLAVRLHSSESVLMQAEARVVSEQSLIISDLERKCLRDCDVIVAQLAPVAKETMTAFGLAPKDWEFRLHVHAPPIVLDTRAAAQASIAARDDMPILFTSKLQRFKRPDLFVRGMCGFLYASPDYRGDAIVCAHELDSECGDRTRALVPDALGRRFRFLPKQSVAEREALIATGIVVVPSSFESYCLAAYEASRLGARVILNGANPAFGEGTPWKDGVNCFKFDGTSLGLAQAIERCIAAAEPLAVVDPPLDLWPWTRSAEPLPKWRPLEDEPLVSIVITHFNLGAYLPETLNSVLEQSYANLEIVLVDDASTEGYSELLVRQLECHPAPRLRVLPLRGNVGLAAARNAGIDQAQGDYVLILDADDLIHPDFVRVAVEALQNNPAFDVVVTPAACFDDSNSGPFSGELTDFAGYITFVGEAIVSGLRENTFSTATAIFRKSLFDRFRYDESLGLLEDWNLYMRICDAAVRIIVSSDIFFYYRQRHDSMLHAPRTVLQQTLAYHDLLRRGAPASLRYALRYMALCTGSPAQEIELRELAAQREREISELAAQREREISELAAQRERDVSELAAQLERKVSELTALRESELVFATLKIGNAINRRMPFLVQTTKAVARSCWRTYRVWSGRD
jgi:glycosyltransferase involved in cell wall biosynthesis